MHDDDPLFRATIRGRQVHLNPWHRGLVGRGPSRSTARGVRVALADIRLDGDEAVVDPVPLGRWTRAAEDALLGWASGVGLTRVWLPARVVDLGETDAPASADVRCPTCGTRYQDDALEFWALVRSHHWYPGTCTVCGGDLPEWQARPAALPVGSDAWPGVEGRPASPTGTQDVPRRGGDLPRPDESWTR